MRNLKQISNISEYLYRLVILYSVPVILNYMWNFGSLAGIALVLQIITGLGLSFWYIPSVEVAFESVEFIMREVTGGWLLRYLHANGASMFFIVVYLHIGRGLYYGSYMEPLQKAWCSGVVIFIVMIVTAFLGYILPWGQMSYWAAMVITSLVSVLPFIGDDLLVFLWGGVGIDQPLLTRVYGLHFVLPFVLVGLVVLHISFVHEYGSTNVLGFIVRRVIAFHPYFTYKDVLGISVALFIYIFVVANIPNFLLHVDNYVMANPGVTPVHIVPEWYFLPFYGILRSVPSKIGGVLLIILLFVIIFVFPYINKSIIRSGFFRPFFRVGFEGFIAVWILLGWLGSKPIEEPYYALSQWMTLFLFLFFVGFNQLVAYFEVWIWYVHYWENMIRQWLLKIFRRRKRARGGKQHCQLVRSVCAVSDDNTYLLCRPEKSNK